MGKKHGSSQSKMTLRESQALLAQSRDRFNALYNFAPVGYLTLDKSGVILEANLTLAQMLGVDQQHLVGAKFNRFVARSGQDALSLHLREVFENEEKHACELPLRVTPSSEIVARMESIVMRDPASKSLQCWNALSDITEHQRNEAALARSNAQLEQRVAERTRLLTESQGRLRAILNTVVDAVIAIDRNGIITGMNPATERMFGYTEAEMLGQNVKMLMPSPHREKHDRYLEKYVHTDASRIIGAGRKMRGQRKDGSTFPIELAVGEVDHLGLFTGVIRDITQRKQLERQLLESAERMQREFGHEMHDGLGQRLTGLELLSHRLARNLQKDSSPRADQAAQLNDELRETLKQARLMAHRLAPVPMEGDGLMRALAELAASTNLLPDVQCHFLCHPPVQIHDATAATHLYRIAQEAVNNALKHGKAGRVNIGLEDGPNDIELTVENNGRTPRAERLSGAVGVGLNLMRYRADLIGANVSIEPLKPRGVRVLCTLPKKA